MKRSRVLKKIIAKKIKKINLENKIIYFYHFLVIMFKKLYFINSFFLNTRNISLELHYLSPKSKRKFKCSQYSGKFSSKIQEGSINFLAFSSFLSLIFSLNFDAF